MSKEAMDGRESLGLQDKPRVIVSNEIVSDGTQEFPEVVSALELLARDIPNPDSQIKTKILERVNAAIRSDAGSSSPHLNPEIDFE